MIKTEVYFEDGEHDYDILSSEDGHSLSINYSDNKEWIDEIRGSNCLEMKDTGTGVSFKIAGMKSKLNLDYMQAEQLMLALMFNYDGSISFKEEAKILKQW